MWFDVQAALAEIDALPEVKNAQAGPASGAKRANRANPTDPAPDDLAHLARLARVRPAAPGSNAAPSSAQVVALRGRMVRLDWSGEWVGAGRYAAMSERERLGPQGKVFCGRCWQERDRETALRCLDGVEVCR